MNNIIYDDFIIVPEDNKWRYYYLLARKLDKKDCVKFALFCAKTVNPNTKGSNDCIGLVEKCLVDEKSINIEELRNTAFIAAGDADYADDVCAAASAAYSVANANSATYYAAAGSAAYAACYAGSTSNIIDIINKYLQILLRKTKQFQNNKILEQISKTDVDKLELVDWNMITDIMQEEYNIIHEFSYENIFSRRCLIELLRREYT